MKTVQHLGNVVALIVDVALDFGKGTCFLSESHWPLQLGLLAHPSGHIIPAHVHLQREGVTECIPQEFLFIIAGKLEVDFYTSEGRAIHTEILGPGQALLQVQGAHGFRFIETSQIIEVKLGPYRGREQDKQTIKSINATLKGSE